MPTKVVGQNVEIVFGTPIPSYPNCRCMIGHDWDGKIGSVTYTWKAKVVKVKTLNLVKRLAAKAIIYSALHQ